MDRTVTDAAADADATLSVLSLVTTADASFYRKRVEALEELGVETTTLPVPGTNRSREEVQTRSPADYLCYVPMVRRQPFERFDLVHANYGLTAPAALLQRELPVVITLWGSDLLSSYSWLSKFCSRLSDEVIVMSEEMREELGRACEVIPHGVDLETFRPIPREDARRRLGWDPERKHVLFPYPKTREVKNYPVAERVVALAEERLDDPVELQVTGGRVPHDEMPVWMSAADVMLLPSEREGSPNTVKEAMACTLPVVSTDVGDVAERLEGVSPSRTCSSEPELVEAVVSVLRSGERSNGREAVRELSATRCAERVRCVYDRVVDD